MNTGNIVLLIMVLVLAIVSIVIVVRTLEELSGSKLWEAFVKPRTKGRHAA